MEFYLIRKKAHSRMIKLRNSIDICGILTAKQTSKTLKPTVILPTCKSPFFSDTSSAFYRENQLKRCCEKNNMSQHRVKMAPYKLHDNSVSEDHPVKSVNHVPLRKLLDRSGFQWKESRLQCSLSTENAIFTDY